MNRTRFIVLIVIVAFAGFVGGWHHLCSFHLNGQAPKNSQLQHYPGRRIHLVDKNGAVRELLLSARTASHISIFSTRKTGSADLLTRRNGEPGLYMADVDNHLRASVTLDPTDSHRSH